MSDTTRVIKDVESGHIKDTDVQSLRGYSIQVVTQPFGSTIGSPVSVFFYFLSWSIFLSLLLGSLGPWVLQSFSPSVLQSLILLIYSFV